MKFKTDIVEKIETGFGVKLNEVPETLKIAIKNIKYLKTDKVIRCTFFI